MACYSPVRAFRQDGQKKLVFARPNWVGWDPSMRGEALTLPCGSCIGCRLSYSRDWAVRCYHEASMYDDNLYSTLTYAEMPQHGSLVRRDLTLFLKSLGSKFGPGIRYFACGEYGDNLQRPHYHLIIFNFAPGDLRPFKKNKQGDMIYTSTLIDKVWKHGHTYHGNVTFQSAAYVARYVLKKVKGKAAPQHYKNGALPSKLPEFTTQSTTGPSKGIGHDWYQKYGLTDCHTHDFCIVNSRRYRPPRYYDKLLEKSDPIRYAEIKIERRQNAERNKYDHCDPRLEVSQTIQESRAERLVRPTHEEH